MARTLGWDVGGTLLKAALADGDRIVKVWQQPAPIRQGFGRLQDAVEAITADLDAKTIDRHAFMLPGNLSDIFPSRRDGLEAFSRFFADRLRGEMVVYGGREGFLDLKEVSDWAEAPGAENWLASAALAASAVEEALFVDMGSTTTDIVPIERNEVCAHGFTDRQRLLEGELVYQGYTRTALMGVEKRVPFAGRSVPVMAELFATMADVQRIIGVLDEGDDVDPPADGGEKTLQASRRRIARMIGMNDADASNDAWRRLAHAFAEAQMRHIHDAALQVLSRETLADHAPLVIAGIGRPVARRLAARLDRGVIDFADLLDVSGELRDDVCRVASASALAILAQR